jgi:hypothetical protein
VSNRIEFSTHGHVSKGKAGAVKGKPARPSKAEREATARARAIKATLAKTLGVGCVAGLALSGYDSTIALHELSGISYIQAAALAIVIDGLLLGAKLAVLLSPENRATARWALAYVIGAGLLSIFLNGAEIASHATTAAGVVGHAILGGIIPVLVLVSSTYVGHLWLDSQD